VNANIAMVTGFSCHHDEEEAIRRGLEAFQYFGYGMGHFYAHGQHRPGRTHLWERFQIARPDLPVVARGNGIGTPAQLSERMDQYQAAGVDQVILLQQAGRNSHENIIASLELFAAEVMPKFKAAEEARLRKKEEALAPYIAAAMARKKRMPPAADTEIPVIDA
jgi:alkanesulfonate monooxygenase SsuD/methylene tetrahydromethanopterin reductase-like flavin-dependent oxidoreductase (luciferase family)